MTDGNEIGELRDQRMSLIARGIDPNLGHISTEKEELEEINSALKTINDTCIALQYDDRGRYGVETIGPLRNVARLINKLALQTAAVPELLEVTKAFVAETVEYATINKLGDPERQHNVKWARSVIAKAEGK